MYQVYTTSIKLRRKITRDSSKTYKHGTYILLDKIAKETTLLQVGRNHQPLRFLIISQLQSAEVTRRGIGPATGGLSIVGEVCHSARREGEGHLPWWGQEETNNDSI
jgi:hypothetical protein